MKGWLKISKSRNVVHHINQIQAYNHMIILVATKGLLIKSISLMIKALKRPGIEGTYLNTIKSI